MITSKFKPPETDNTILVFSRKDANNRRITNHEQIVQQLKKEFGTKYHIQEIVASGKTYLEVGKYFYNARLVISPHGAGLSHLLFMRCGTGIIEVGWYQGDWQTPNEYYCFSRALGIKYGLIIQETYYSDLTPDINETIMLVKDMLNKSSDCGVIN